MGKTSKFRASAFIALASHTMSSRQLDEVFEHMLAKATPEDVVDADDKTPSFGTWSRTEVDNLKESFDAKYIAYHEADELKAELERLEATIGQLEALPVDVEAALVELRKQRDDIREKLGLTTA